MIWINKNELIINAFLDDATWILFHILGLQTESHHFQLQMKNQLTLENRQVHMLFGVVILFLSGYTLRFVLNLNELHSILIPKNGNVSCPNTLPSWIHVSKTNKYFNFIIQRNDLFIASFYSFLKYQIFFLFSGCCAFTTTSTCYFSFWKSLHLLSIKWKV